MGGRRAIIRSLDPGVMSSSPACYSINFSTSTHTHTSRLHFKIVHRRYDKKDNSLPSYLIEPCSSPASLCFCGFRRQEGFLLRSLLVYNSLSVSLCVLLLGKFTSLCQLAERLQVCVSRAVATCSPELCFEGYQVFAFAKVDRDYTCRAVKQGLATATDSHSFSILLRRMYSVGRSLGYTAFWWSMQR